MQTSIEFRLKRSFRRQNDLNSYDLDEKILMNKTHTHDVNLLKMHNKIPINKNFVHKKMKKMSRQNSNFSEK